MSPSRKERSDPPLNACHTSPKRERGERASARGRFSTVDASTTRLPRRNARRSAGTGSGALVGNKEIGSLGLK
jgi:hypothetical protein